MTRAMVRIGGPFAALVLLVALFFAYEPLRQPFGQAPPPLEQLTVERTILDQNGIRVRLRADGTEPVTVAQVQIDGAYWQFRQDPPGAIPRLGGAWIEIPYPWVVGEAHKLLFITRNGVTFEHEIEVAWPTPQVGAAELGRLTVAGLFLGLLPVALGMLFYPALRAGGATAFQFALALTVGLLAFLLVDTLSHALELAGQAAPGLKSVLLVWLVAVLTALMLWSASRWRGTGLEGRALAIAIAFAIGLHNFGEGLAVGTAFATGAVALGGFLMLGFAIHNVTEGIGIIAPVLDRRPSLLVLAGLAALAGLPAIFGLWFGAFAYASHWGALALAVGVGAIIQVVAEVGALLWRQAAAGRDRPRALAVVVTGLVAGVAIMYATALLVVPT